MDENYQIYLNRAMRLTLPDTYRSQVQHIQESAKFRPHAGSGREAVPFPGYTVITPPAGEDLANQDFYATLTRYQQQIVDQLNPNFADFFVPVPPDSFHVTLADLIWDSDYRHASENPDFDPKLQNCIAQIFQQCQPLHEDKAMRFQVIGLMAMTRAIAVCLVPTDEIAWERLLKFRRGIYQNHDLMSLGIEQQYYFTPHITLGYFGAIPSAEALAQLSDRWIDLNQTWLNQSPQEFSVQRAELRKFDDMTRYDRQSDWAVFDF